MAAEETVRRDIALNEKGVLVESLWHAVDDAAGNLEAVPGLLRRVLETEAWRRRIYKGKTYEHQRFLDFIESKPLAGCGWEPGKVEALIKDDAKLLAMWRAEITGKKHVHRSDTDNISIKPKHGTSRAYTLDRLKREQPDIFARVVAGELTANAAAIEAGFRKSATPLDSLRRAWRKASAEQRAAFIAEIDLSALPAVSAKDDAA
jgi:hypothetical protein